MSIAVPRFSAFFACQINPTRQWKSSPFWQLFRHLATILPAPIFRQLGSNRSAPTTLSAHSAAKPFLTPFSLPFNKSNQIKKTSSNVSTSTKSAFLSMVYVNAINGYSLITSEFPNFAFYYCFFFLFGNLEQHWIVRMLLSRHG